MIRSLELQKVLEKLNKTMETVCMFPKGLNEHREYTLSNSHYWTSNIFQNTWRRDWSYHNSCLKDLIPLSLETIKLLEENITSTLFDIGLSNIFLDLSSQARKTKVKINKWGPIKLKRFCTAKETINKTKRQPTEWEKIFPNDMTDKGLIFNIYKQLIEINIKKTTKFKNA